MKIELEDKEFEKILKNISEYTVPQARTQEDVWLELSKRMKSETHITIVTKKKFPLLKIATLLVAASIIVMIGVWFFTFKNINYQITSTETLNITLPDNSIVIANANTQISYSSSLLSDRQVKLKGEAYFKVEKGGKFIVDCGGLNRVEVVGTEFNVFSRDSIFEVTCFSGKVLVTTNKISKVELKAGEMINESKTNVIKDSTTYAKKMSWIHGEFYYNDVEIRQIFAEIERQYGVTIEYNSNSDRFYSGYFRKDNLENTLTLVCTPMNFQYKIEGKKVIIINQ